MKGYVDGKEYRTLSESPKGYDDLREELREDGCELVYCVESEDPETEMVTSLTSLQAYVQNNVEEWLADDPEEEIPEADRTIMEYGLLDDGYGVYEPTGNYWEYDPQAGRWKDADEIIQELEDARNEEK